MHGRWRREPFLEASALVNQELGAAKGHTSQRTSVSVVYESGLFQKQDVAFPSAVLKVGRQPQRLASDVFVSQRPTPEIVYQGPHVRSPYHYWTTRKMLGYDCKNLFYDLNSATYGRPASENKAPCHARRFNSQPGAGWRYKSDLPFYGQRRRQLKRASLMGLE